MFRFIIANTCVSVVYCQDGAKAQADSQGPYHIITEVVEVVAQKGPHEFIW